MRYLIIGNSAAGLAAGKAIRRKDQKATVILFSDEPYPYYSRLLITYLLRGEISKRSLFQGTRKLYHDCGLQAELETRITEILPAENRILTSKKKSFSYDRLLMATGSIPVTLPIPGAQLPGVLPVRTLEHAEKIRQKMRLGNTAVILGGGLVGMQTAQALHQRGMKTILVVSSDRLLSRNLDLTGAQILRRAAEKAGLRILFRRHPQEIAQGRAGKLWVLLDGGESISGDMAILAKGVIPNVGLLKESAIAVHEGALVNEYLETSRKDIYAAGDVAEWDAKIGSKTRMNPIWPNAVEQGFVAGLNMTGNLLKYRAGIPMNVTQLFGIQIASIGNISAAPHLREQIYLDPGKGIYRNFFLEEDRIEGALLIGDIADCGILRRLIQNRNPVSTAVPQLMNHSAAITHVLGGRLGFQPGFRKDFHYELDKNTSRN
jgi:nitrite reductase (NADH) large subunit